MFDWKMLQSKKYDFEILVNNFEFEQGDLVLGDKINENKKDIKFPNHPYFIADVNNANGADKGIILQLFEEEINNFYGYCAYNTSANTVGCAIFCAIVKFLAIKNNSYNHEAFLKFQFIRFLDDWAYQANIRQEISEPCNIQPMMKTYETRISELLELPIRNEYFFPWERLFEIEVCDELF